MEFINIEFFVDHEQEEEYSPTHYSSNIIYLKLDDHFLITIILNVVTTYYFPLILF